MNENLQKILSLYCNNEIENLMNTGLFIRLQNLVNQLNWTLVCEYGKELDCRSENLHLSITIFNYKNEMVEVFDDGFLTVSTPLILVDKKHNYRFLSWTDREFIADLNWLIEKLEDIKTEQSLINKIFNK